MPQIYSAFNYRDRLIPTWTTWGYLTMTLPFVIWVMQGCFGSLSRTYEESASLEGCSRLQVLC